MLTPDELAEIEARIAAKGPIWLDDASTLLVHAKAQAADLARLRAALENCRTLTSMTAYFLERGEDFDRVTVAADLRMARAQIDAALTAAPASGGRREA